MERIANDNLDALTAQSGGSLLNAEQAARFLNLSESYIRKAVAGKKLPHCKIGTRVLFRRTDLDRWIEERLVPTNAAVSERAAGIAATAMLRGSAA